MFHPIPTQPHHVLPTPPLAREGTVVASDFQTSQPQEEQLATTGALPPPLPPPPNEISSSTIIGFIRDATSALTHSVGLSSSFVHAAQTLDRTASLKFGGLAERSSSYKLPTTVISNEEQATKLRAAGVELYNIIRKGPQNHAFVVRLRVLACDCMYAAGTSLKNADGGVLDELDTVRAYAVTGVLALKEKETFTLGMKAVTHALDIGGQNFLAKIGMVFGDYSSKFTTTTAAVQEANEVASAQFGALVGYLGATITTIDHTTTALKYLTTYKDLVLLANHANQKTLRDAVETGACMLVAQGNYVEATPWLQLLCGEYEALFAMPGQRARNRAMLAICLARLGDAIGATKQLDNRGASEILEADEEQTNWWWSEGVARVAVGLALVQDEIKGGGDANRVNNAKNRVYGDFETMVIRVLTGGFSPPDSTETSALLETAANICTELGTFEHSYGMLWKHDSNTHALTFQILNHAFECGGQCGMEGVLEVCGGGGTAWITPNTFTSLSLPETEALAELKMAAWKEAESSFTAAKWERVEIAARLVIQLANNDDDDDKAAIMQCKLAMAIVTFHRQLPDPLGDAKKEMTTLRQICSLAHDAAIAAETLHDSASTLLATTTELRALCRMSAIQTSIVEEEIEIFLRNHPLPAMDAIRVSSDAMGCGAHQAAVLVLEFARDGIVVATTTTPINMELLVRITQKLMECRSHGVYVQGISHLDKLTMDASIVAEHLITVAGDTIQQDTLAIVDWIRCFVFNKAVMVMQEDNDNAEHRHQQVECVACMLELSARLCEAVAGPGMKDEAIRSRVVAASFLLDEAARSTSLSTASSPISKFGEMATACLEAATAIMTPTSGMRGHAGGLIVFASLYTAVPNHDDGNDINAALNDELDEAVKDRVNEIVESYSVEGEALVSAAKVAVKFHFHACARHLCITAIQTELARIQPNYGMVGTAIVFMLQMCEENAVRELVNQFDTIWKQAGDQFSNETLEFAAISLWKLSFVDNDVKTRAIHWLEAACKGDDGIRSRRSMELRGMMDTVSLVVESSSLPLPPPPSTLEIITTLPVTAQSSPQIRSSSLVLPQSLQHLMLEDQHDVQKLDVVVDKVDVVSTNNIDENVSNNKGAILCLMDVPAKQESDVVKSPELHESMEIVLNKKSFKRPIPALSKKNIMAEETVSSSPKRNNKKKSKQRTG